MLGSSSSTLTFRYAFFLYLKCLLASRLNKYHVKRNLNWSLGPGEKNEMDGACSTNGDRRGLYRVLVGKREGKRPLGRPRPR
jgi:hypothetical protein